jgi:6-phosphogluconolactonase
MPMRSSLLYVGQYTRTGKAEGILTYERDPDSGRLRLLHAIAERDPSFLAFDPSRRLLFAVNELRLAQHEGHGTVASFAVDGATGALALLSRRSTEGGEPCHVTTDPTGTVVLVANHEDGSVSVFPLSPDGQIGPLSDLVRHEGSGPAPSQKGPHAHFVTFDPTGQRILVADKGIDKVMLYRLDRGAGPKLVPDSQPFFRLHPGAAPRHIAFHPNGRFVYINGEADLTVTAFSYDAAAGTFRELHNLSTLPGGARAERQSTAQILVHPNGRFLYVSNRGHNSIAIFAIDQETGRLTALGHEPTQGQTPRNFVIDASGAFLYVANQNSDTIAHFRIDEETGRLTPTGDMTPVAAPVCLLLG